MHSQMHIQMHLLTSLIPYQITHHPDCLKIYKNIILSNISPVVALALTFYLADTFLTPCLPAGYEFQDETNPKHLNEIIK